MRSGLFVLAMLSIPLIGLTQATANVDIWNEDGVAYRVLVTDKSGQVTRSIAAGNHWKGACENCVVKITPVSGGSWSDQIEASGQDVVTIEHGSLRVGEGSRK